MYMQQLHVVHFVLNGRCNYLKIFRCILVWTTCLIVSHDGGSSFVSGGTIKTVKEKETIKWEGGRK